jgi:hypothetical protein
LHEEQRAEREEAKLVEPVGPGEVWSGTSGCGSVAFDDEDADLSQICGHARRRSSTSEGSVTSALRISARRPVARMPSRTAVAATCRGGS